MNKGLTATQIKIIAIIAMVCDHFAWTMLDFFTPLAQIMHIIGRLTIPIMSFFIAEGFRHTRSLKRYILRILTFAVISIIPFYMFFGEMYGYRQNILFDLLTGLLVLSTCEHKQWSRCKRRTIVSVIFLLSLLIGGWPVIPILFILIFYYQKKFNKMALLIGTVTVSLVLLLVAFAGLNQTYHFLNVDIRWNEKLYLLGFVLALPILKLYNGQRGFRKNINYFFYIFYPLHFLLLLYIKRVFLKNMYDSYLHIQYVTTTLIIILIIIGIRSKQSKMQQANVILSVASFIFLVGYYLELTTESLDVVVAAIKVEYIGTCFTILAYTWFMEEFCKIRLSKWVYIGESFFSGLVLYSIFNLEKVNWFYRGLKMVNRKSHRIVEVTPGFLYYIFYVYFLVVFITAFAYCYRTYKESNEMEKDGMAMIVLGSCCPWIVMVIKVLGFSQGYDIMAVGILGYILCFTFGLLKYDYFSAVQTTEEMDALTGLSNRRYFIHYVESYMEERRGGAMIMMDVDNFKFVNDNYGHGIGDHVLIALSNALKQVLGNRDLCCRLGGDEFCAFLLRNQKKEELSKKTDEIVLAFHNNLKNDHLPLDTTISFGIAIYDGMREIQFDEIYTSADKALYLAKNSGKNQLKFFGE